MLLTSERTGKCLWDYWLYERQYWRLGMPPAARKLHSLTTGLYLVAARLELGE
jgi:hypothetical protein